MSGSDQEGDAGFHPRQRVLDRHATQTLIRTLVVLAESVVCAIFLQAQGQPASGSSPFSLTLCQYERRVVSTSLTEGPNHYSRSYAYVPQHTRTKGVILLVHGSRHPCRSPGGELGERMPGTRGEGRNEIPV